jgi:hypothetical protein
MGGIVARMPPARAEHDQMSKDDIDRCRLFWRQIVDEETLDSSQGDPLDEQNNKNYELVLRLSKFLQKGEGRLRSLPQLKHAEHFVQSMLQIIYFRFIFKVTSEEWTTKLMTITKRMFIVTNAQYEHLLLFQRALQQILINDLQEDFDLYSRQCWSRLMNSILQRIISLFPSINIEYLKKTESERMYTASANAVAF